MTILLTSYSFKSRTDQDYNHPKQWVIEGSHDNGNTWELIHEHPSNDDLVNQGVSKNWETLNNDFFRFFKIVQTGENGKQYVSSQKFYFSLNKIEFFGDIIFSFLTCENHLLPIPNSFNTIILIFYFN